MTPVGGPPVLAVGHKRPKILLKGVDVQALHGLAVVKVLQRVGLGVVLVKNVQVQGIGPPGRGCVGLVGVAAVHHGALSGCVSHLLILSMRVH